MKTKLYKTGILMALLLSGFWVLSQSTGGITWLLSQTSSGDKGNSKVEAIQQANSIAQNPKDYLEFQSNGEIQLSQDMIVLKMLYERHTKTTIQPEEFVKLIETTEVNWLMWKSILANSMTMPASETAYLQTLVTSMNNKLQKN